eukprot:scaffold128587_cov69-Phaeocystis_antarctica.AAC.4
MAQEQHSVSIRQVAHLDECEEEPPGRHRALHTTQIVARLHQPDPPPCSRIGATRSCCSAADRCIRWHSRCRSALAQPPWDVLAQSCLQQQRSQ